MLTGHRSLIALAAALGLSAGTPAEAAADGARIAQAGNGAGAAPCAACHGTRGEGNAAAGFPRLAALPAGYIVAQLQAMAAGTRANPVMMPIAKALTSGERQAVAAYYAALSPPAPVAASAAAPLPVAGKALAEIGRWSQQLPACDQCHGPGGVGVGAAFPPLAAQPASYLRSQLQAWKDGRRAGGPLDLMGVIARKLDLADIQAVADYYAARPARAANGGMP